MEKLSGFVAATAIAIGCAAAAVPAHAQAVYKCSPHSYSQAPCSARVVRTYEAPAQAPHRAPTAVAHRLPGETGEQFALRKRRAGLAEADRDECARLDARIPFDQARLKAGVQQEEVDAAQDSLAESRRRYRQLRC